MGAGTFNQPQQQGYGGAQAQSTSGKAGFSIAFGIIAMLTWVIWGALLFAPAAIVLGAMARKEIRTDPAKTGDGMALAGIILGAAVVPARRPTRSGGRGPRRAPGRPGG